MRKLSEIAPGVYVANWTKYSTNTTVVAGAAGGCLVIDPGVTVTDLRDLVADLAEAGLRPVAGFATHPHWDHVLWDRDLGDVPRYASAAAVATADRERTGLIEGVTESAPGHDLDLFAQLTPLPPGADGIDWPGPRTEVVTHDGHAPGHSAIFLPDSGVLVAGDMCSDIEIPLLDLDSGDPVGDYRSALEAFAALPVRLVVPGHGSVTGADGFRARVAADLRYLDDLERGAESADQRITGDWLESEYRAHAAAVRPERPVPGSGS
ncbi:MAG: MBL fold metallo-hydrolase [Actinomycetota bacterium]|nr:MBL fold metallo-hydrolase [Actinomycetota bacterium]